MYKAKVTIELECRETDTDGTVYFEDTSISETTKDDSYIKAISDSLLWAMVCLKGTYVLATDSLIMTLTSMLEKDETDNKDFDKLYEVLRNYLIKHEYHTF